MKPRKKDRLVALSKELIQKHQHHKKKSVLESSSSTAAKKTKRRAEEKVDSQLLSYYSSAKDILVVGDGNFSFSKALSQLFRETKTLKLTATVFDGKDVLEQKYPEAIENVQALEDAGATVAYNVDGSRLELDKRFSTLKYDCIVFHFPHVGAGIKDQDRNVAVNQQLLLGFFTSAQKLLRPTGNIHVSVRRGLPYDLWTAPKLARMCNLKLLNAVKFDPRLFPGYAHRRTIGVLEGISAMDNEELEGKTLVTYIFGIPSPTSSKKLTKKAKKPVDSDNEDN